VEAMQLDPEFLAALPPDIQAELIQQQAAAARAAAAMRARESAIAAGESRGRLEGAEGVAGGEGRPAVVEMDSASIIATFPPELREEVLLTSDEALLAALPPELAAEAQLLRERMMQQYTMSDAFPGRNGRGRLTSLGPERANGIGASIRGNRAAEASARAQAQTGARGGGRLVARGLAGPSGSGMGVSGIAAGRGRQRDMEGGPLLEEDTLVYLVRLVRLTQPLAKGLLQRLLLNLCSHSTTRTTLLRLLLVILHPQQDLNAHPQFQLFGSQAHIIYSRGSGVPPLVSRRVLEVVTYLARHHPRVAPLLASLPVPSTVAADSALSLSPAPAPDRKGKGKMQETDATSEIRTPSSDRNSVEVSGHHAAEDTALQLLLQLLTVPRFAHSSGHLEQALALIELVLRAVIASTERAHKETLDKEKREVEQQQQATAAAGEADPSSSEAQQEQETTPTTSASPPGEEETGPRSSTMSKGKENPASPSSAALPVALKDQTTASAPISRDREESVLERLGPLEMQGCAQVMGREGLSDAAYLRCTSVLQLLASVNPANRRLFVSQLSMEATRLAELARAELVASTPVGENVPASAFSSSPEGGASAPGTGRSGSSVLRVIQAVQALTTQTQDEDFPSTTPEERLAGVERVVGVHEEVRRLQTQLQPLWEQLSACVTGIESQLEHMGSAAPPGAEATAAGPSSSRNALPDMSSRLLLNSDDPGSQLRQGPARSLPPLALHVLPLVEAFFSLYECSQRMLDRKKTPQTAVSRVSSLAPSAPAGPSPSSSSLETEPEEGPSTLTLSSQSSQVPSAQLESQAEAGRDAAQLLRFAERHRKLLNALLRTSPTLVEGSLRLLLKTPRLMDFDNKRHYFRSQIERLQAEQRHLGHTIRICVRRPPHLLEDSFRQLRMRTGQEMQGRLTVQFQGEEGIDAGGVTREWYTVLAREMFNVENALFVTVGNNSATFQPNPNSYVHPDHLSYFKFIGRVVGKALYDGQLLDAHFARSFYKHMLGVTITYEDIEAIDPDYYKNLKWMLENDITGLLDLNFSAELDHFGRRANVELKAGGQNIVVTEANKAEYVSLISQHRMTTAIQEQIACFKQGFHSLVPKELVAIFDDRELELLLSGLPEIDVDDLQANTEYTGYTAATPVIQWFWEVVRSLSEEDLARFLQFCTGTTKVPLEGFKALQGISGPQRFQIHRAYGAPNRLASAHTCFNQLDLPEYPSKEQLKSRLTLAIHEGNEGFGFG